MTHRLQTLAADKHQHLRFDNSQMISILASSHLLLLRANEVIQAACSFPVFFSKASVDARPTISALCAFQPSHNLFVRGEAWEASFTPKSVNTQPLALIQAENDKGYAIALDIEHPAVSSVKGAPLFVDGKKCALWLSEKSRLLETCLSDDKLTQAAIEHFQSLGLVADIDMLIEFADGTKQPIYGLSTVNEARLAELDADTLYDLQKKGMLMLLHAMLLSLYQVNGLIRLHNTAADMPTIANVKFESPKQRHTGERY